MSNVSNCFLTNSFIFFLVCMVSIVNVYLKLSEINQPQIDKRCRILKNLIMNSEISKLILGRRKTIKRMFNQQDFHSIHLTYLELVKTKNKNNNFSIWQKNKKILNKRNVSLMIYLLLNVFIVDQVLSTPSQCHSMMKILKTLGKFEMIIK